MLAVEFGREEPDVPPGDPVGDDDVDMNVITVIARYRGRETTPSGHGRGL